MTEQIPQQSTQEQAMEQLRGTLASGGWNNVIVPTLQEQVLARLNSLCAPTRPEGTSDDFLRGQIDMLKYVIGMFRKKLAEYDTERTMAQQEAPPPKGSPYTPDTPDQVNP